MALRNYLFPSPSENRRGFSVSGILAELSDNPLNLLVDMSEITSKLEKTAH